MKSETANSTLTLNSIQQLYSGISLLQQNINSESMFPGPDV